MVEEDDDLLSDLTAGNIGLSKKQTPGGAKTRDPDKTALRRITRYFKTEEY